jgi:hypothetical protein
MFTNEAPEAWKRTHEKFCGRRNDINGNAIIQGLTIEYGSFEEY